MRSEGLKHTIGQPLPTVKRVATYLQKPKFNLHFIDVTRGGDYVVIELSPVHVDVMHCWNEYSMMSLKQQFFSPAPFLP